MGLFNSAILDVIIGLIFVYLLLSIICTAANEWVAALTRRRGKMLKKGIMQLLSNQATPESGAPDAMIEAFYRHPLISSLMHDTNHPNYMSPRNFSATLVDILTGDLPDIQFNNLQAAADALPNGEVKQSILALFRRADNNVDNARTAIEGWFNDAMDRVSGWYKRRTQLWTVIIALALTLIANADTIQIVRKLWTDPVLRAAVVEEAKVRAQKPRPTVSVEYRDEDDPTNPTVTRNEGNRLSDKERDLLSQIVGWRGTLRENVNWFTPFGWLLTILAISMGAPFWFDMLNKIMNIRYAGKSPDEKAKTPEKSDSSVRA
ncbi:MAG TPA: hypothetical protein VGW58_00805 [Pyrinomonadaceae bacterium]|nr:hypothetical protein [Pyrinomonadaceae bacterium]